MICNLSVVRCTLSFLQRESTYDDDALAPTQLDLKNCE